MDPDRFLTYSLRDLRIARVLSAALEAVEPGRLVRDLLSSTPLPPHDRIFLLGLGKASEAMVMAAAGALPGFTRALIITKHATTVAQERVTVIEGGHPIPDARSIMAGRAALDFVRGLTETDLLICCISGGGSALVTAPHKGIALRDMQQITGNLLTAGARIDEINTLRRHLDDLKGGGLARATRAQVLSLLLSDVAGDRLEAIASGPTAPDPSTAMEALAVLDKYEVPVLANIYSILSARPRKETSRLVHVTNIVIGNNELAARAALRQAEQQGFHVDHLQKDLDGEARQVGRQLAGRLKLAADQYERPFCLIAGGETTVTVLGDGKGGRNQELALASVDVLAGTRDVLLITLATDGDDGPTDAAGAVVTGKTKARAQAAGLQASDFLERNDSYSYFQPLGDLLKPGYSGTNVNDLVLLAAL